MKDSGSDPAVAVRPPSARLVPITSAVPEPQTDPAAALQGVAALPTIHHLNPMHMQGLQRAVGNQAVNHLLARTTGSLVIQRALLDDFNKSFPDSVALIKASPEAMKLVAEATKAGTKFGGFSEDGPAKIAWPYTAGDTVYVPKARTDKVVAMSDFLFEINNAIRSPAFAALDAEAKKGSKGSLTAKTYAYKKCEQEVEGMLRLGEVWFETKKTMTGGKALDKYDADFFLGEYNAFKAGKKSKDDIIKTILAGANPANNKTHEQIYMEQYVEVSGGK